MPLPQIEVTVDDRAALIARNIINQINQLESQVLRMRADQPAIPERERKDPRTGEVIGKVPAQPAVTKADIDARLGTSAQVLDALEAALASQSSPPTP